MNKYDLVLEFFGNKNREPNVYAKTFEFKPNLDATGSKVKVEFPQPNQNRKKPTILRIGNISFTNVLLIDKETGKPVTRKYDPVTVSNIKLINVKPGRFMKPSNILHIECNSPYGMHQISEYFMGNKPHHHLVVKGGNFKDNDLISNIYKILKNQIKKFVVWDEKKEDWKLVK